ncbi:MAG: hypothetical protein M3441_01310 [Chloroflexota bacterium]|nr:hypothetical protein [Chloroflexota bacterium]
MREAVGARLGADPVKVVEVLSRKHARNGDEQKGILRHLIEGSDLSLWVWPMHLLATTELELLTKFEARNTHDLRIIGAEALDLATRYGYTMHQRQI